MNDFILRLTIGIPGFLVAIIFHEWAHAYVANRLGDPTAKNYGRMTLNPVPHIDPIGTLLFPLLGAVTGGLMFGWARPVPIEVRYFKNIRQGIFWVSFAGPLMNIILAVVSAFLFVFTLLKVPSSFYLQAPLIQIFKQSIYINMIFAGFNLIPIPPLDGSRMVSTFLSYEVGRKYDELARYSFVIFILLLVTGAISYLLAPALYMANGLIRIFYSMLA